MAFGAALVEMAAIWRIYMPIVVETIPNDTGARPLFISFKEYAKGVFMLAIAGGASALVALATDSDSPFCVRWRRFQLSDVRLFSGALSTV